MFTLCFSVLFSQEHNLTMNHHVVFLFTLTLFLVSFDAKAQQNYTGNSIFSCKNDDKMGASPSFLYTCNGLNKSCLAFLIFKSKPPFNSIATISNLTSSNQEELARIKWLHRWRRSKAYKLQRELHHVVSEHLHLGDVLLLPLSFCLVNSLYFLVLHLLLHVSLPWSCGLVLVRVDSKK